MAFQFADKGNIWWLLFFGFAIGFSTTIAEPALIAIATKAGKIAAQGNAIPDTRKSIAGFTGVGLIALASLTPILFVMLYGMIVFRHIT